MHTLLFIKKTLFCLFFGLVIVLPWEQASGYSGSQRRERPVRPGMEQDGIQDEQRLRLAEEAQGAMNRINQNLRTILELAQRNQRPAAQVIEEAESILEQSKQYASVLNDAQKDEFMLLQAWKGFYQKNPVEAVNWSMRACRTNEASQDAWISQALFCMLSDKRPLKPQIERPRPQTQQRRPQVYSRPRRNEEMLAVETKPQPFSEKGILAFDLMGMRDDLLREQFGRLEFRTASGKKVEYRPGTDTLCMLLWQQGSAADANDVRFRGGNNPANFARNPLEMEPIFADTTQNTDIESQRSYMKMLAQACKNQPNVKFVQMNADASDTAGKVAQELAKDSSIEEAGALVFAADPASNAGQFTRVNARKPFLMIVNKEGKIKYAGTAGDFVPAFILTELTGIPIPLEQKTDSGMGGGLEPMLMPELFLQPIADPNARPADPNALRRSSASPARPAAGFRQLPLEEEVQAEKELSYARDLFMELAQKRGLTYTRGVELCREIIRKYPNTRYEQEARLLLRQVPENQRARYQLTNQELGL